jgi:hypothetical protein
MLKLPDFSAGPWNICIDPPDEFQPQITGVLPHPPASKLAFGTTFIAAAAAGQANKNMNTAAVRTPRTFIAFTSRDFGGVRQVKSRSP